MPKGAARIGPPKKAIPSPSAATDDEDYYYDDVTEGSGDDSSQTGPEQV